MGSSSAKQRDPETGEYLLLQIAAPQREIRNFAVLLLDPRRDHLYMRFPDDLRDFADEYDIELLAALPEDFRAKVGEQGGEKFLLSLEDTLSNFLRLSERRAIPIRVDFKKTLDDLFAEGVVPAL